MSAADPGAQRAADAGCHLTLHYRITLDEPPHTELLSTFGGNPATLVLGSGELAPALERCLVGARVGAAQVFALRPGEAFGVHRADLLQRISGAAFPEPTAIGAGQVVEFSGPGGVRYPGLVRSYEGGEVLVDFNHPLAGRPVRFEVETLAVL